MTTLFRRILKTSGIFVFTFVGLNAAWVHAYEVDDFSERNLPRADALPVMNRKVNEILEKAAAATREESKRYCSRAHLRQEILRWIRPDPAGLLEIWANTTDQIEQTKTSYKKSIYGGVGISDSPALWFVGIGRSMRLSGYMVGTDKIGHFFMQGLDYYDRVSEGKPLERVLAEDHGEDGVWGMTGVKSYADMSANYAGYRFWSELTQGENPFFKCVDGQGWVKQREFTWANYVNDAWDEGINCSEMKTRVHARVSERLQTLGMSCPVDFNKCAALTRLDQAQFVVSPKCRSLQTAQVPF